MSLPKQNQDVPQNLSSFLGGLRFPLLVLSEQLHIIGVLHTIV